MGAGTPKALKFPAAARLKTGRDFGEVRQLGERLVLGCLILNWRRLPPGGLSRVGVVVSRKVGDSVLRSRTKRLLRECYRLHQHNLAGPVELVLVARQSIAGKMFADVEKDFLTTLRKTGLLKLPAGETR